MTALVRIIYPRQDMFISPWTKWQHNSPEVRLVYLPLDMMTFCQVHFSQTRHVYLSLDKMTVYVRTFPQRQNMCIPLWTRWSFVLGFCPRDKTIYLPWTRQFNWKWYPYLDLHGEWEISLYPDILQHRSTKSLTSRSFFSFHFSAVIGLLLLVNFLVTFVFLQLMKVWMW